jgi:glycolate oxidase
LDVLPEVVQAVAGRSLVAVDGGINRGSDVVKALALGADAVGIGRLFCCALAAGGTDGVVRMLDLLKEEVHICLALLGVTSLQQLSTRHLHAVQPIDPPHVFSSFPLLAPDDYTY